MVLQPLDGVVGILLMTLLNSEYLTMALYDTSNVKQMELKLDYLSADAGFLRLWFAWSERRRWFTISGTISDVLNAQPPQWMSI